jgi:PAS domain S-box-containing protein
MKQRAMTQNSTNDSRAELELLRARLEEAEATLSALRNGEVDAVIIGEQVYMLESAEAASNRLRGDALALVHDAVIVVDQEGCVTYLNAAAERLYGVAAVTSLGRAVTEVFQTRWLHPNDEAAFTAAVNQDHWRGETIHIKRDGTTLYVESSVTVLHDRAGSISGRLAIIRDITERYEADAALRQSEDRFRNMADHAPVMIWMTDASAVCTFLSQSWYDFTGQTPETGLGFGWLDATHPDDKELAEKTFLTANAPPASFRLEYRLRRWDGSYAWAIDSAQPRFDLNGNFLGYIGSVIDITERKQAEEDLRESEERFRTLFNSIDEGFCIIEMIFDENNKPLDYRFEQANPIFEMLTGLENAVGKTARELIPNLEEFWFETYGNVALTGEAIRFENHSAPMQRWFEVHASRVGAAGSRRVAIVFNNITQRKAADAERERLLAEEKRARATAEAATRAKDEFLTVVSHELRTPLNAILGYTRMARLQAHDPIAVMRHCQIVERSAKAQQQLIEDLLDTARIISGKLKIEVKPTDLRLVLQEAFFVVLPAATAKQINLVNHLGDEPQLVIGDAARLQQVAWNLLQNAIKFTPNGGRVELRLERDRETVSIVVSDSGQGIEPEFLDVIFDRFSQRDMARTRRYGGLGLGLALVKDLVALHGGTVTAESEGLGKGATFTIKLPPQTLEVDRSTSRLPAVAEINTGPDAMPMEELPRLDKVRILVVDDQPEAREMVAATLREWGAIVTIAASGPEARQLVTENPYHVLVCDIAMPDEDGYSVITQIRAIEQRRGVSVAQRLPAIALTALARPEDRLRALNAGFQMHVAKPVELAELVVVVNSLTQNGQVAAN